MKVWDELHDPDYPEEEEEPATFTEEQIEFAMSQYDSDGDGFISPKEWLSVLNIPGGVC